MPSSIIAEPVAATRLAVSLGDAAGIGPEIIAACWRERRESPIPAFLLTAPPTVLARLVPDLPVQLLDGVPDAERLATLFADALPVLPAGEAATIRPGHPDAASAAVGRASLDRAVDLALAGSLDGVVTAPVAKAGLYAIGFAAPGQTEYLASRAGLTDGQVVMMLAGPSLRTVPLTIHIPLTDVAARLTSDLIVARARITAQSLERDFAIAAPRLVLAGLNPHAGEDGALGSEERTVMTPAVAALRAEGRDIRGPVSADSLFHAAARQTYDAALCAYHDQALIPVKALDFDAAVNVTLGLPFIRTSPDHGTAFDIAGRGIASPRSMQAALRMAGELATNRRACRA